MGTKAEAAVSNPISVASVQASDAVERAERCGTTNFRDGTEASVSMAEAAQSLAWGRDEAEVVSELQAGSEAAFDSLIRHYHAPVFNLLLQMLGNHADAADTAQEVFLKAFRGIRHFRGGSQLKTWLYRIAIREALNQRRWWWRHRRKETPLEESGGEYPALQVRETSPGPYEQLASLETQQVVRRALLQVSEVFRGAVVLRDLEGLAYEEVAEILDVSVGTVKSRIMRGRRELRELLEPVLKSRADGHAAIAPAASRGMEKLMAGGEE